MPWPAATYYTEQIRRKGLIYKLFEVTHFSLTDVAKASFNFGWLITLEHVCACSFHSILLLGYVQLGYIMWLVYVFSSCCEDFTILHCALWYTVPRGRDINGYYIAFVAKSQVSKKITYFASRCLKIIGPWVLEIDGKPCFLIDHTY